MDNYDNREFDSNWMSKPSKRDRERLKPVLEKISMAAIDKKR